MARINTEINMNSSRFRRSLLLITTILGIIDFAFAQAPMPKALPAEKREALRKSLSELKAELKEFEGESAMDAAIFAKGLEWGLDYDAEYTPADEKWLDQAVARCRQRIALLKAKESPWKDRRGKIALGYVSKVDGSVQPYGVIVPKNYDPKKPIRLDVVLHGSQKPVGMNELRFIGRFDEGDAENPSPPEAPFIELHPLGRVENCYRWAGETDVFEAISDVCSRFNIDTDRQVLRGMSMGASGTWHLGLKHPDRFVALGPYCGYVDTHKFSETQISTFVKIGPLPEHQELGLHMLDSVDYAANAGVVPAIAAMGEKDIFFDAHVIMGEAMKKEGLEMVNLISPGTGHVIDPVTHAEQMRRIGEYADKGLNRSPESIRFVTWTLKYAQCFWLTVEGLDRHYHRAEISAKVEGERLVVVEPTNINHFAIFPSQVPGQPKQVRIGTTDMMIPAALAKKSVEFERRGGRWQIADETRRDPWSEKNFGMQGPIDVAFMASFLCVRGTCKPWNPAVHEYAEASLRRFASEWRQYFRGELPIKNDVDVTEEDIISNNLILFGDAGSNLWINKYQDHFPIRWTREAVTLGDVKYPAANHLPAFIMPNPKQRDRYIVINSGHTFRGADLGKINYLLFPRWGDWAVLKIDPERKATDPVAEEVLKAGYFDEEWKLP